MLQRELCARCPGVLFVDCHDTHIHILAVSHRRKQLRPSQPIPRYGGRLKRFELQQPWSLYGLLLSQMTTPWVGSLAFATSPSQGNARPARGPKALVPLKGQNI